MLYHLLQCRESPTLDPRFDTQNVNQTITSVIENQWLDLSPVEEVTCLIEHKESARNLLISKDKEGRDFLMWNYAGALVQTGEWRTFHSVEHAWMMLATFWGTKAPELVPTCTTWQELKDSEQPIRISRTKRHIIYLKEHRDSDEFATGNT